MMTQRYHFSEPADTGVMLMEASANGSWVRWADVQAEIDRLTAAIRRSGLVVGVCSMCELPTLMASDGLEPPLCSDCDQAAERPEENDE